MHVCQLYMNAVLLNTDNEHEKSWSRVLQCDACEVYSPAGSSLLGPVRVRAGLRWGSVRGWSRARLLFAGALFLIRCYLLFTLFFTVASAAPKLWRLHAIWRIVIWYSTLKLLAAQESAIESHHQGVWTCIVECDCVPWWTRCSITRCENKSFESQCDFAAHIGPQSWKCHQLSTWALKWFKLASCR